MKQGLVLGLVPVVTLILALVPGSVADCSTNACHLIEYDDEIFFAGSIITNVHTTASGCRRDWSTPPLYNSVIAVGSIKAPTTDQYDIRYCFKAVGDFQLGGQTIGAAIEGAGTCWPTVEGCRTANNYQLYEHKFVPFRLRMRTGCSLYNDYVVIQWRLSGTGNSFINIPSQYIFDCEESGCEDGWVGSTCSTACSRATTCSNHGDCRTDGTCICDDAWTGLDCGTMTNVTYGGSGLACPNKVTHTRYDNEISFASSLGSQKLSTVLLGPVTRLYDSGVISGSIRPEVYGNYRFRLYHKPYGELTLNGVKYNTIGPAGSCWNGIDGYVTTGSFLLHPNQHIPFQVRYRTGCDLYEHQIRLEWEIDGGSWLTIPAASLFDCPEAGCLRGWYGSQCNIECDNLCSGNGACNDGLDGDGSCICNPDYTGVDCDTSCDDCMGEMGCLPCSGHGSCTASGCECQPGWVGTLCQYAVALDCPNGVKMITYTSENAFGISTPVIESEGIVGQVNMQASAAGRGILVTGSLRPSTTANYEIRGTVRPRGTFTFDGTEYPTPLGSGALSCDLASEPDSQYQGSLSRQLNAHQHYSFTFKWQTGCSTTNTRLRLEWRVVGASTWEVVEPADLFQCARSGCQIGYYSNSCGDCCKLCLPEVTCSSHGSCDAAGECDCHSGWSGADCSTPTGVITYAGSGLVCNPGVVYTRFDDELFFTHVLERGRPLQVDITGTYLYDSLLISGAIVPAIDALYEIRLEFKAYGELFFNNTRIGNSLGPGGSCLDSIAGSRTTDQLYLRAHQTYPFTLRVLTGCSFYDDYVRLLWKKSSDDAFSLIPSSSLNDCQRYGCEQGFFGTDCSRQCVTSCNGHGGCNDGVDGDGACLCDFGWVGPTCNITCNPETDCSGNGVCADDGTCDCFDAYIGDACTVVLTDALASIAAAAALYAGMAMVSGSRVQREEGYVKRRFQYRPWVYGVSLAFATARIAFFAMAGAESLDNVPGNITMAVLAAPLFVLMIALNQLNERYSRKLHQLTEVPAGLARSLPPVFNILMGLALFICAILPLLVTGIRVWTTAVVLLAAFAVLAVTATAVFAVNAGRQLEKLEVSPVDEDVVELASSSYRGSMVFCAFFLAEAAIFYMLARQSIVFQGLEQFWVLWFFTLVTDVTTCAAMFYAYRGLSLLTTAEKNPDSNIIELMVHEKPGDAAAGTGVGTGTEAGAAPAGKTKSARRSKVPMMCVVLAGVLLSLTVYMMFFFEPDIPQWELQNNEFKSVSIGGDNIVDINLLSDVSITNNNAFDLSLNFARLNLIYLDEAIGEVTIGATELPPGTTVFPAEITVSLADTLPVVIQLLADIVANDGELVFSITGEASASALQTYSVKMAVECVQVVKATDVPPSVLSDKSGCLYQYVEGSDQDADEETIHN